MIQLRYKIVLLLALLTVSVTGFAASEAEYQNISRSWEVKADGSQEYRYSMELTLFTHTAMNNTYGESFVLYNPKYQELKINTSYTKQKDGTIIKTPENAFVEVLPRFATNAPEYNHLKEMVIVHTGLELGATIYLDYSITTQAGYYPGLEIYELLQETSPVKEYSISINTPENTPVYWQLDDSNAKASETTQDGKKTLRWNLRNIPASSREPFLTQNRHNVPKLIASSYPTAKEALAVVAKRFNESVSYEANTFAQYITENAKTDQEKIDIIHKHVADNMANSAIPFSNTGFTVRNADIVLRSAYGTLAEKTQLLDAMLRSAGIESEVIIIYPGTLNGSAYNLSAIKGMAVRVMVDNKPVYLSPVSTFPSAIPFRGELDKLYRLDGSEVAQSAESKKISEQKELSINKDQAVNGYILYNLPTSTSGVDSWRMNSLNSRREQMLEIPSMIDEVITYTINLPEGVRLQTPTGTTGINKPFGKVNQSITLNGNTVEVKRSIEINQLQFSPSEYTDFRALINEWVDPGKRLLVFTTQPD